MYGRTFAKFTWRRVVAVLPLALLAGCWFQVGPIATGNVVEHEIDVNWRPSIIALNPELLVGVSSCPRFVNTSGAVNYCLLPVNGQGLHIKAWWDKRRSQWFIEPADAVLYRSRVHLMVGQWATSVSGQHVAVRCRMRDIAVLPVGTKIRCTVLDPALKGRIVQVKVMKPDGNLFIGNDTLPRSPQELETQRILDRHDKGLPAIAPSAVVERFIESGYPPAPIMPKHKTICPPSVDLTGSRHAQCLTLIGNMKMHDDVWIARGMMNIKSKERVFEFPKLIDVAERFYRQETLSSGQMQDVEVTCPRGGILMTPPAAMVHCNLRIGSDGHDLVFQFTEDGRYRFYVPSAPDR